MAFKYRCVAGPSNIQVHSGKDLEKAVQTYEDIINKQAADGWEYVGIDEFLATQQPGCLSFWSAPTTTTMKMLVFKRPA